MLRKGLEEFGVTTEVLDLLQSSPGAKEINTSSIGLWWVLWSAIVETENVLLERRYGGRIRSWVWVLI